MSVYFAEKNGRIKIGFSERPQERAKALSARLLAFVDGSMAEERAMHERFDLERIEGEWFAPSARLLSHIATLPPLPADPPPSWISVKEAADRLGVSQDTVRRHCDLGNLRCIRPLGGPRKVSARSVDEHAPDSEPAA